MKEKVLFPAAHFTGNIIDLHCDTILYCYSDKKLLRSFDGHINARKLREGGCLAQCFALFIPTHDCADEYFGSRPDPWELYQALLKCYRENIADCADLLRPALSPDDLQKNREAGLMSSILTIEDCVEIDGRLDRFDAVWRDGVRMMALTWNYENCIGFPNSADQREHTTKGLKEFGFQAVEKMNDLGIIIDVSHLSEAGFYDVARTSRKPFAASHSCCRALADHPRNLTDDQLRVIGDTGSIVGVNFYDVFLGSCDGLSTVYDIVRHMIHIRDKAGIEAIALGSDMDGIESELEFRDYAGFPMLIDALQKEFTDDEIDRICSGNFLRVFAAQ